MARNLPTAQQFERSESQDKQKTTSASTMLRNVEGLLLGLIPEREKPESSGEISP